LTYLILPQTFHRTSVFYAQIEKNSTLFAEHRSFFGLFKSPYDNGKQCALHMTTKQGKSVISGDIQQQTDRLKNRVNTVIIA
jgi:hypothetical protein